MRNGILIAGLFPIAASCSHAGQEPMNVLFIMADDLRPSLGCYGDTLAKTPHIDALAAGSAVYLKAYCQQALSGPSRASLLTGLRPDDTGVTELDTWMREKDPSVITMPQAFREQGYVTRSIGKTFHGRRNTLDSLSWSAVPVLYSYSKADEYQLDVNRTGKKASSMEFADIPEDAYQDTRIRNEAVRQLKELASARKPFFLAVGFLKPHLPFCAPKRFLDMYSGTVFPDTDTARIRNAPALAYHDSEELRGYTDIPDAGALGLSLDAALKKAYYACVSYVDENIGILLEELERSGISDNTAVVVLGDHGYHTGEAGLWCKSTNYEAACRAPLIIRIPGRNHGIRVDAPVEFVDVFPTLAAICGINVPENLPGKDLSEMDKAADGNYAFSQFQRPYRALHNSGARTHWGYAVRDEGWRYVEWYDLSGSLACTELYDMRCSDMETENLAGVPEYGNVQARLSRVLRDNFGLE